MHETISLSVAIPLPSEFTDSPESLENPLKDETTQPIIELKNVHKTYLIGLNGIPALRGISVKIYPGEWVMIYGTSGGGKTSLLNLMGTIDKPTKGEVKICGEVITSNTQDETLASLRLHRLGFVFQNFNLLPSMTALENVSLPMILKGSSYRHRVTMCERFFKQIGLNHRLHHFPNQLSGGEQQRVTFARAMANGPSLILLDEPTGDLDGPNSNQVMKILHKVNSEHKTTLVMVTHDMYLKNLAHRVLWLRDGKIVKEERVSSSRRAHALRELYQPTLQPSQSNLSNTKTHHPNPSSSSSSSSHSTSVNPHVVRTETREPQLYPTFSDEAYQLALQFRQKTADTHLTPNGIS